MSVAPTSIRRFHSYDHFSNEHSQPPRPQQPPTATTATATTSATATASTASSTGAIQASYQYIRKDLEKLIRATTSQSLYFWLLALGGVTALVFLFWDTIIQFWGKQGADVANRSLSDEELLRNATDSLKRVTTNALQAPETVEKLVGLLKSLLEQPETRVILVSFLLQVLKDQSTQAMAKDFFSIVLQGLLDDPSTQQTVVQFLKGLLADPNFQASAVDLVKTIAKNQATRDSFIELLKYVMTDQVLLRQYAVPFARQLLAHPYVQEQVSSVGERALHDIFDNPNVREHTVVFVKEILEDQALHKQGGNALWEIIKNTFTPSWFSPIHRPIGGAIDDPISYNSQLSSDTMVPKEPEQPVENTNNEKQ